MKKQALNKHMCAIITAASFLSVLALVIILHASVRLIHDDFFYYPFAKHGLACFINNLKEHYLLYNGRVFVHSICALLLTKNLFIFRAFNILTVLLSAFLTAKIIAGSGKKLWQNFTMVFLLFWLLGNYIICESVLWIAGSLNYNLPLFLALLYIYLLINDSTNTRRAFCITIGFLSSLTTELSSFITILLSVIILSKKYKKINKIPKRYILGVVLECLGFLFLVLSPGMHDRLVTGEGGSMGDMLFRASVNLSTFIQMSLERNGLGAMLVFALLASGISAYKTLNKKVLAFLLIIFSLMPVLTMTGVIFYQGAYFVIAFASLMLLLWYSICLLKENNAIVFSAMVCFSASFGIMCMSGVIGYRMLFLPAVCLMVAGCGAFSTVGFKNWQICVFSILLAIINIINLISFIAIRNENAKVWDRNHKIIDNYNGGETIVFENMPDELYFQSGVPTEYNYGDKYMAEFSIPSEVYSYAVENSYADICDENGLVTSDAVKRQGVWYIWFKELADYLDAGTEWKYDNIEITYKDKLYRFHYGARSVTDSYIAGKGKRLDNPVRIIDSKLYISIDDANRLFDINLKIVK